MIDLRQCQRQLRFSGAANLQQLADKQVGPTCGFEAIENLIQLFYPVGNNLAETVLLPQAYQNGYAVLGEDGYYLSLHGYRPLLLNYGIEALWYAPDFYNVIMPALFCNRGIVAVGNAYFLAPHKYPPVSRHAFLISNYYVDPGEQYVEGFIGLDSNVQGQECQWSIQSMHQALNWSAQNQVSTPVLVTAEAIQWIKRAPYYRRAI